jgi:hypothetical protein
MKILASTQTPWSLAVMSPGGVGGNTVWDSYRPSVFQMVPMSHHRRSRIPATPIEVGFR